MIHFDENKPYNPINYSNGQWIKFGCGFIIVLIVTILGLIINSFFLDYDNNNRQRIQVKPKQV